MRGGYVRGILFAVAILLPALGGERTPALSRLLGDLASRDQATRYRASESLGDLGDLRAVPALVSALEDPDPSLKARSLLALSRLTGQGLGQEPPAWRAWWTSHGEALMRLQVEEGRRATAALGSKDYPERFSAARSLATLGCREAIPVLIAALDDESLPFRWRCAKSLTVLTGENFVLDRSRWESWWKAVCNAPEPVEPPPPDVAPVIPPPPAPDPELEARLKQVESERDRLTEEAGKAAREAASIREERDRLQERIRSLPPVPDPEALKALQERAAALERELADRGAEQKAFETQAKEVSRMLERAAAERQEARKEAEALRTEHARLLAELEAERKAARPASPPPDPEALRKLQERAAALEKDLAARDAEQKALESRAKEAEGRAAREGQEARKEAEALRAERARLQAELEAARKAARPLPPPPVPEAGQLEAERARAAELSAELERAKAASERDRAEARRYAEELEILRAKAEAGSTPVEVETPKPLKPEPVNPDSLDQFRARHRRLWSRTREYVIQRDESLSEIAKKFGTDVDTLLYMNRENPEAIRDKDRIFAGYTIQVPAS